MLRPATVDDLDDLRRWRNHPAVRAVSLTRHEISAEEHRAWWARASTDESRQVLVYVRADEPAGVVTYFDLEDEDSMSRKGWWGYYLDNAGLEARGELLPAWIQVQREAVRYADEVLKLAELHGEVVGSNEAVRRMNRRNGFSEDDSEIRDVDGEQVEVFHVIRRRPPVEPVEATTKGANL